MDLAGYLVTAIVTLSGVIGVLWRRDQAREKKLEQQRSARDQQIKALSEEQRKGEMECRKELAEERAARERYQDNMGEWLKESKERDQEIFINLQRSMDRLGSSISEMRRQMHDEFSEHDAKRETSVMLPVVTDTRSNDHA